MIKKAILSMVSLIALTANAQQKSKSVMINAARQTLVCHFGVSDKQYGNLKVAENIERLAVVASADGGTAFVNRQTGEVMGCSPSVYTSREALPCGLQMWINAANNAIKYGNESLTRAGDYSITEKVESFMNTKWSQSNPYNLKCPKDAKGKKCVTGCVATAMAQVMKYYEYPKSGVGEGSYSINNGKSFTPAAISGTYDWENMKTAYSNSYSDAEANAVATLMRDCGYSVNMMYTSSASSSADADIPHALTYNFSYDSLAVNYIMKNFTAEDEWYNIIYTELTNKRPVILSGASATSDEGHCFVLDGVDTNGEVHVNWGWGGYQDGFYDMTVFNKDFDYITEQSIVYGFNPTPTAEGVTPKYRTCIGVDSPSLSADKTNLLLSCGIYNFDWRVFCGNLYLKVVDTSNPDNKYLCQICSADNEDDLLFANVGFVLDKEPMNEYFPELYSSGYIFPVGTYEISFVYQGKYDDAEKTAFTTGGTEWKPQFTVAADGSITINDISGISTPTIDKNAIQDARYYDLNGNRVGNSFKGLKISKGWKEFSRNSN